ncbi:MAG TPA: DUF488 family protein [Acidimicrobiales bacterium]|nr:DUF488 family protein [Acidimicrobiales bacterium]
MSAATSGPQVEVRRIYEDPKGSGSEQRMLVDRLWPRGLSRGRVRIDEWCKEAAPSTELRQWYGHDPDRFEEFARRYRAELRRAPGRKAVEDLVARARRSRKVVLLTATKDVDRSGAAVLAGVIRRRLQRHGAGRAKG